jgi:GNAT superfamily N-acetyltransferase
MKVRPMVTADVDAVGVLVAEFQDYLRSLGDRAAFAFDAEKIRRDGFGDDRAFDGFVAESDDVIVGYVLYHFGYDTDIGERLVHLIDLFVSESNRRSGAGRALMAEVRRVGREGAAAYVFWSVFRPNALARSFYESVGAEYVENLDFMTIGC